MRKKQQISRKFKFQKMWKLSKYRWNIKITPNFEKIQNFTKKTVEKTDDFDKMCENSKFQEN